MTMIEPTLFPVVEAPRKMPDMVIREAFVDPPYRWWLRRGWGSGPAIAWIGLNPSIANSERDDPTMLREIGFSFRWGYGSLVKLNLYPFISPSPKALLEWRSAGHDAHQPFVTNAHQAADHLRNVDMVMAAWGANLFHPTDLNDFFAVVESVLGKPVKLHCLGTTMNGSPKHTLARGVHRVPDDAKPVAWEWQL